MYNKLIKEWFENDRPREKFMQKGCAALSDTELLSILIVLVLKIILHL